MFEWDAAKAERTLRERGISFDAATAAFDDPAFLRRPGKDGPGGEPRTIGYGRVRGLLLAVVFTMRGDTTRIISARRAKRRERQAFEQATGEPADPEAG